MATEVATLGSNCVAAYFLFPMFGKKIETTGATGSKVWKIKWVQASGLRHTK